MIFVTLVQSIFDSMRGVCMEFIGWVLLITFAITCGLFIARRVR